ncbi:MAG: hypothetical protein QOH71_3883 [Blastocatellia bacterium]|jgi:hypothetical protein|nr:hypothetical protein [Blastocatellia bacterium]
MEMQERGHPVRQRFEARSDASRRPTFEDCSRCAPQAYRTLELCKHLYPSGGPRKLTQYSFDVCKLLY